jgi:hypothetical protein
MPRESTGIFRNLIFMTSLALLGCSGGEAVPSSGLPAGAAARLELDASYPEPFSFLNSVREREDGTVVAADPLSQVVLHLDLLAGTADTLGRVGEGPGEYRQPDQVFPLPGDSTLLVDIGKMQLTVIAPDGTLLSGMKMASAAEGGRFEVILPRAVDDQGRLYLTGSRGIREDFPPDSTLILRYDRASEVTDTMGWIWRPEPIVERSGSNVRMVSPQMEGRDDWAVGPQGEFAIVRVADYSVEWRFPDGRITEGPPNPVEPRPIRDEDKRTFLDRRSSDGLMMMVTQSSSGGTNMMMRRGGAGMGSEEPALTDFQWAEVFAPFRPDRARVSPSGELWVERWLPSSLDPQVDVFDGEGVKVGIVAFPQGRELVGFGSTGDGASAAYLVRTDEFDLKWLERYRIIR